MIWSRKKDILHHINDDENVSKYSKMLLYHVKLQTKKHTYTHNQTHKLKYINKEKTI